MLKNYNNIPFIQALSSCNKFKYNNNPPYIPCSILKITFFSIQIYFASDEVGGRNKKLHVQLDEGPCPQHLAAEIKKIYIQ